jgi:hypothetical protein
VGHATKGVSSNVRKPILIVTPMPQKIRELASLSKIEELVTNPTPYSYGQ